MLVYFMAIENILRSFVVIRYIFPCFGILCKEKSGNPAQNFGRKSVNGVSRRRSPFKRSVRAPWPRLQRLCGLPSPPASPV
jgi:hypothetical protein